MEYKCPQCGKSIVLSRDELVSQGNLVVCPQCLSEFEVDAPAHGENTSQVAYGYGAHTPDTPKALADSFVTSVCIVCGNMVQSNFNYCPFCGRPIVQQQYHPSPAMRRPLAQAQVEDGRVPTPPQQPSQRPPLSYVPQYRYGYKAGTQRRKMGSKPWFWAYMIVLLVLAILLVRSIL